MPAEGYITISNSCTVYAYAVKDGEQSETVSESYTAITPVANSITSEELARYNIEIDNTTSGGFARTANVNISYYSADRSQIIIRNIFGYGNAITANVTWNSDGTASLSYNKGPIHVDSYGYYYVQSPTATVGNNYSGIGNMSGTLDADKITISSPWQLVVVDANGYYDDIAIDATLTTEFVKSNATMKYDEVDVDNGGIMASYTIPVYAVQEDDEVYVYNFANLSCRPRLILNNDGTWYNENQTVVGSYGLYPCDTQELESDYNSFLTGNATTRALTWGEWAIANESSDACYYWQDSNGIYHNAIYTYGEINLDFDLDLPMVAQVLPPVVSPAGGEVPKNTALSISHENGDGYTAYWTTSDIRSYTLEQLLADDNVTISDGPCVITQDVTLYFLVLADDYSAMSNVVTYTYTIPEEPVTLAWLATNGVSGKTYTIADDLHIGGYRENTEDDLIRIIYAKDDNGYANESDLANYPGAVDYMAGPGLNMSVSDYDQSNWIGIYGWELTSVKNITKKIITGGTLRGVFTKDAGGNMSITIEDEPEVTTGSVAYVPNTYITCAFMGETQVAANGKTYFFVTPKPGELCHIKWAVYDGNGHFYVPASVDGANSNGLVGGFDIDWTYFRENGGSVGKFTAGTNYEFDAIVMKKASTGSGAPRRVEADNSVKSSDYTVYMLNSNRSEIPTGITGAKTDAKVVSVKYVNPMGIESDKPFEGINIVVTRYDNGTTSTSKVLK
ncbi:MAG: hypothetical protein IK092_02175 [Muribaculaceae bacterium]|nr:hypothetical protein [Muribaculaceae bacterium]